MIGTIDLQTGINGREVKRNLSSILNTTVSYPEGVNSPIKIERLLGLPQRQTFS